MLKSKEGYLLTETIIAITVVATIITIVYAIIMNNLVKQNNDITKNNTAYGMYVLKEARKYYQDNESAYAEVIDSATKDYIDITNNGPAFFESVDIVKIYFLGYDKLSSLISSKEKIPYSVKKDLKTEIKDMKNPDKCKYRYLIIFKETEQNKNNKLYDYSYATMGAECSK